MLTTTLASTSAQSWQKVPTLQGPTRRPNRTALTKNPLLKLARLLNPMSLPVARAQVNPLVVKAPTREVTVTVMGVKAPNAAEREVDRAIMEGEVMADTTNSTTAVTVMVAKVARAASLEAVAANVVEPDNVQYYW